MRKKRCWASADEPAKPNAPKPAVSASTSRRETKPVIRVSSLNRAARCPAYVGKPAPECSSLSIAAGPHNAGFETAARRSPPRFDLGPEPVHQPLRFLIVRLDRVQRLHHRFVGIDGLVLKDRLVDEPLAC